ncbi:MAG: hypothetical protein L0Z62_45300, partial [Gemmataceae bacterium]|nr:hypothetical protein [Gemmataceae bacterium]
MTDEKNEPTFEELLALLEAEPPEALRPNVEGLAYRFTLFLPLLSGDGKEIFSADHCSSLARLFGRRLGGYSANALKGEPPWIGAWLPEGAPRPVID